MCEGEQEQGGAGDYGEGVQETIWGGYTTGPQKGEYQGDYPLLKISHKYLITNKLNDIMDDLVIKFSRPLFINTRVIGDDSFVPVYGVKVHGIKQNKIEDLQSYVGYLCLLHLNQNGWNYPVKVVTHCFPNIHCYMDMDGNLHGGNGPDTRAIEDAAISNIKLSYHIYTLPEGYLDGADPDYFSDDLITDWAFFYEMEHYLDEDDLPF